MTSGIILDWNWWIMSGPEIDTWIVKNYIIRTGSVLYFPNEEVKVLFVLKWL